MNHAMVRNSLTRSKSILLIIIIIIIIITQHVVHMQHTFVFPILLGEFLAQPHVYPKAQHGLAALGAVGVSYLSW